MRIWHFILGYVIIKIEGLSLEKFLNIAVESGIRVWDIKRESYTVLKAGLSARGYFKLLKITPERYNITVQEKYGLPLGAKWLTKRKALLAGLILVAFSVLAAAQFVWNVRVNGVSHYEGEKIKAELSAMGIGPGVYKGGIDLKSAATKLVIAHDEFAWADVSFDGVVLTVKILLADMPPSVYDENTPCNIVAKKDAYIESVIPLAGEAVVKAGDTVRAGDVLISGLVWDPGMPRMLFAARGRVWGNVWYKGEATASVFREVREKTGRTQTQRVISIGADTATIDGECTFKDYDTEVIDEYSIGAPFLPISVKTLMHSEINITKEPMPFDVLRVYLEERAYYRAQALAPLDARIIGHTVIFDIEDDIITARVYLNTREDIGKTVYLEEQIGD